MSGYIKSVSSGQNYSVLPMLSQEDQFDQLFISEDWEDYSELKDGGINLNAQDCDGNTILMYRANRKAHVITLLRLGADPWIQNEKGKVFLDFVDDFIDSVLFIGKPSTVLLAKDVREYLVTTDEQFKKLMEFLERSWVLGQKGVKPIDLLLYTLRTLPAHYVKALLEDRPERFNDCKKGTFAFDCWISSFYDHKSMYILAEKGFDPKVHSGKYTPLTHLFVEVISPDCVSLYVEGFLKIGVNPWSSFIDNNNEKSTILDIIEYKNNINLIDTTIKFMALQIKSYKYTPCYYKQENSGINALPLEIMLRIFSYISVPSACKSWHAIAREIRLKEVNFKAALPDFPLEEKLERASHFVKRLGKRDQEICMDFFSMSVKKKNTMAIWGPFHRRSFAIKIANFDPVFAYAFTKSAFDEQDSYIYSQKKWALLYVASGLALGGFDQKAREIAEEILKD